MDIKTLEYMNDRVQKGTAIQKKIATLLEMKQLIALGREIRIDICGCPYQWVLGYDEVNSAVSSLIDTRLSQLEKEFSEI